MIKEEYLPKYTHVHKYPLPDHLRRNMSLYALFGSLLKSQVILAYTIQRWRQRLDLLTWR